MPTACWVVKAINAIPRVCDTLNWIGKDEAVINAGFPLG
jgi:hypothetical protein